tara:strand:+ start:1082 stop:1267 length:186 start_codon:yes stop_codon:yes gene_type:complete
MRTEQLSITFPKNKIQYKEELIRQRDEENLNISGFMLSCLEKEIGYIPPKLLKEHQNFISA